jgi:ribonuclease T2
MIQYFPPLEYLLKLTKLPGSGFTLTSSKGKCAIVSGALSCASTVTTATVFTASGNIITNGAGNNYFASATPSGTTQATIFTASHPVSLQLSWVAV